MELIGIQTDIAWEDRQVNFARVRAQLASVRVPPGSLLVLPEMFGTGFTMNASKSIDSSAETERFLTDLARRYECCVVAGLNRKSKTGATNESVAIGADGSVLGRYQKMHPFSPVGEAEVYQAGGQVSTFRWGGFTVAVFICYDLRFPEIFRAGADMGADLFAVIANWPAARTAHWTTLLRARAIENQAYVIGVNRVGSDPHFIYSGKSIIVDPQGEVMAEGGSSECLVRAMVEPRVVSDWRVAFPALRDRCSTGPEGIAAEPESAPVGKAGDAQEDAPQMGFGEILASQMKRSKA